VPPGSGREPAGTEPPNNQPSSHQLFTAGQFDAGSTMADNGSVTAQPTPVRPRAVMRREPVQRRSAARVVAILDACARLLDDYDYDELTTSKIAEKAGVPIGSLYQYFPDKRAVVQALTLRNLEAFSSEVEQIFAGEGVPTDWRQAVDRVVAGYLRMLDEVPGFGRIRFGDVVDTHLLDPDEDNNAVIADKLAELFAKHYQVPHNDELRLAFRVVTEASDVLIKLALRLPEEQREAVLNTTLAVIRFVLGQHLDR
jgi:AcrR family transcriptional regulator